MYLSYQLPLITEKSYGMSTLDDNYLDENIGRPPKTKIGHYISPI